MTRWADLDWPPAQGSRVNKDRGNRSVGTQLRDVGGRGVVEQRVAHCSRRALSLRWDG
jgi:hypothetical protein